jgi:spermidine/putrescine transport system permease protein
MSVLNQSQPLTAATPRASARRKTTYRSLGQWAIAVSAVLAFLFIYIPILILIVYSFNASRFSSNWEGFTLDWYRSLLQGGGILGLGGVDEAAQQFAAQGILQSLRNSLIIAAFSTVIASTLGTMIALGMERYRFKLRQVVDIMLYLPIIIPEITMGISLVLFFNLLFRLLNQWFGINAVLGFPTIIISHVAFNISFVAVVVRARLAGMDPALEEAAQDAGANEWQTFWRIVMPLIMPGVLGGALMAFTLSLDDFVITFYTAGIGSTTLPLFVYGMIKFTVTPAINAISTLMMIGSMVLVTLSLAIQRQ